MPKKVRSDIYDYLEAITYSAQDGEETLNCRSSEESFKRWFHLLMLNN
jgi:hypothetical protein